MDNAAEQMPAKDTGDKSVGQVVLERMRANSVRFRELVNELDLVLNSIMSNRKSQNGSHIDDPRKQAATSLFEGLEMLALTDHATARELEQRVKELRTLF